MTTDTKWKEIYKTEDVDVLYEYLSGRLQACGVFPIRFELTNTALQAFHRLFPDYVSKKQRQS